ncbi:hypothetical protein HDU81_006123 [Chytriomyces hyalinus]|nr:hypothetical protein HDU81_006123 [Chytriomyces hyalinus]
MDLSALFEFQDQRHANRKRRRNILQGRGPTRSSVSDGAAVVPITYLDMPSSMDPEAVSDLVSIEAAESDSVSNSSFSAANSGQSNAVSHLSGVDCFGRFGQLSNEMSSIQHLSVSESVQETLNDSSSELSLPPKSDPQTRSALTENTREDLFYTSTKHAAASLPTYAQLKIIRELPTSHLDDFSSVPVVGLSFASCKGLGETTSLDTNSFSVEDAVIYARAPFSEHESDELSKCSSVNLDHLNMSFTDDVAMFSPSAERIA